MLCRACVTSLRVQKGVLKDDVSNKPTPAPQHAPWPLPLFLLTSTPMSKLRRRDSRKPKWRVCLLGVGVVVQDRTAPWNDGSMFFFSSPLDWRVTRFPVPPFCDPYPVLKIRLQTQAWVIDYPDCGLLGYLTLQTLRQNSTTVESTRWPSFLWFCLCALCPNHDLGFESKLDNYWQLLLKREIVSATRLCCLWTAELQVNGLDLNGHDGYRRKPQTENRTPNKSTVGWAPVLSERVWSDGSTRLGNASIIKISTQITT